MYFNLNEAQTWLLPEKKIAVLESSYVQIVHCLCTFDCLDGKLRQESPLSEAPPCHGRCAGAAAETKPAAASTVGLTALQQRRLQCLYLLPEWKGDRIQTSKSQIRLSSLKSLA